MSKVIRRIAKKDEMDSHVHRLSDGSFTEGPLYKPNKDMTYPHSHLYQYQGKVFETEIAPGELGHHHMTVMGETSAPDAPKK